MARNGESPIARDESFWSRFRVSWLFPWVKGVKSELDFTPGEDESLEVISQTCPNLQHPENGTMFKVTTRKQTKVTTRKQTLVMFKPCLECLEDRITPSSLGNDLAQAGLDVGLAAFDYYLVTNPAAIPGGVYVSAALHGVNANAAVNSLQSLSSDTSHLFEHYSAGDLGRAFADALSIGSDLGTIISAIKNYGTGMLVSDIIKVQADIINISLDITQGSSRTTQPPPPSSSPSPSPSPSSGISAIAGTYSGTLTPSSATDQNGSTARQVTLTINADGSGSLSISPFEGNTFSTGFRATVTQESNGLLSLGATYTSAGPYALDMKLNNSLINGNQLMGQSLELVDNSVANGGNSVFFNNFTLTKS